MMRQLAKCECVRWPNCLRPDSLRGSFYNREASNIKYADEAEVSKRGNSPVEGTNYSIGSKFNLTPVDNHNFYLDLFSSKL